VTASLSLRRAERPEELAFLSALANDPSVEPFLAPGRGDLESLRALNAVGAPYGLHLIEANGERVGGLALMAAGRTGHICEITRVMVRPQVRGAGIATAAVRLACRMMVLEHGLHRIETQVYGDNLRGQRLFERAGFTREGARRSAYWRREQWLDGVYYGMLAEEL
jgi:RimJ/RimL family protein N-acetyltransferase